MHLGCPSALCHVRLDVLMIEQLKAQPLPQRLRVDGQRFTLPITLPVDYEVYDFTEGYNPERMLRYAYGIGRYDEPRPTMYAGEQFKSGNRHVHTGIDIAAPSGEAVRAFFAGEIFGEANHAQAYDYGPTLITKHRWLDQTVFALHGHLSRTSLGRWEVGQTFERGSTLGWVGGKEENGGWNPHLHFQLSLIEPIDLDLPGAVGDADRAWARRAFPDPQDVLGQLY